MTRVRHSKLRSEQLALGMTWRKIVQAVAVSACPECGNAAFDLEPGEDLDDPNAKVKCGACGFVCSADKFMRSLGDHERRDIEVR
jgi:hypothetical protein